MPRLLKTQLCGALYSTGLDAFELTDAEAPIVAEICRTLDGIALAIEIAAVRAETFGVAGLAARLDDRFRLLMRGRRTALTRCGISSSRRRPRIWSERSPRCRRSTPA